MPRWLLPFVFVLALFARFAPAQDHEIITVNPGDGVPVAVGGWLHVDNHTSNFVWVQIKRADGSLVAEFGMAPKSVADYRVPKDASLIGQKLTTTATDGTHTATATNPIVAPSVANDDADPIRASFLDRALGTPQARAQPLPLAIV
ncbi:MAG: hypothetical protein HZA52_10120 [Planctomycetes bacterium]|nr:hypothetical protein [Planctomycetota bacterium]